MTAVRRRIPFVRFCETTLRLTFTVPWRVLLRVAIDGVQPRDLEGEERDVARKLFGDVEEIDPRIRRVLVWRLGRASGKSTIAAALAVYGAWTCDLSAAGRGQVPCAFVVSPTKPIAKIAVGIARELVRETDLDRYVLGDTGDGFTLRRPDRRVVEIRCVAASKGGANLRGRDVIVLILDESEFFASNDDGADGYSVTDRDQIAAVMPRLLEYVVCISTPWPTDNVTAEYFDRNHGRPQDAVAALGTSMFMRPTAQLAQDIEREMARDEENALREYECVAGTRGGSRLFDIESIRAAIVEDRPLTIRAVAGSIIGAGGDLGLERDASAIAVAARAPDGACELLEFDEVRPAKGAPLSPGYVVRERFAPVMRTHRVGVVWLDAHYRQSAIEHLTAMGLAMADAPPGIVGKYDVYMHTRGLLRAGQLRIPNVPRLIAQLRAVTSTPLPLGKTRITSPRRAGSGHGDIVSAFVLACWAVREGVTFAAQQAAYDAKVDRVSAAMVLAGHGDPPAEIAMLPSATLRAVLANRAFGTPDAPVGPWAVLAAAAKRREAEEPDAQPGRMSKRERVANDLPLLNSPSSNLSEEALDDMVSLGAITTEQKRQYLAEPFRRHRS